jgi:GDP-D-mannose dehydratase
MSKKAIITGITGQDGSCLAEFLLFLGYEVHQWIPLKRRDISYSDPNMIASKLPLQIFLQSQTYSDTF